MGGEAGSLKGFPGHEEEKNVCGPVSSPMRLVIIFLLLYILFEKVRTRGVLLGLWLGRLVGDGVVFRGMGDVMDFFWIGVSGCW